MVCARRASRLCRASRLAVADSCRLGLSGDFNTGNVWRSKKDASTHLVADWQVLREGPCGQDWVTFIGTVDPDAVSAPELRVIIGKYHDALSTATGGAAAREYPIDHLLDDIALINPCYWMIYMFVFANAMNAAEAGEMPQDKYDYTCNTFW